MATTAENLSLLQTTKESLKTAIESKGRDLTNVPFTQYPQEVAAIQTGSAENKLAMLVGGQNVALTANDLRGATDFPLYAFYQKNKLTSIEIPKEVATIGQYAFTYCSGLTSLTFEDGSNLTTIGNDSFMSCTNLVNVILPNKVTSIGSQAFNSCTKLQSIIIPNSVTTMSYGIFGSCYQLKNITIPASVISMGATVFYNCTQLQKVIFEGQVPNLQNNIFYNCTLIELFDFSNCTTIPTLANVNTLGHKTGCKIVVPDALYDTWTTASVWSSVTNVVWVKASEYVGG